MRRFETVLLVLSIVRLALLAMPPLRSTRRIIHSRAVDLVLVARQFLAEGPQERNTAVLSEIIANEERKETPSVQFPSTPLLSEPKETYQMDHSSHALLVDSELNEENLLDAVVYGADDQKIGTVSHVHGMGSATQVIVDVGGFLGIGAKPVALTTSQLTFMRDKDGDVHATTTWTKEQVKALPEHHH